MEKITFIVVKGQRVELKPDGRKCKTCPLRDNMYCPVNIMVFKVRKFMLWGQAPDKNGVNSQFYCYWCQKFYMATRFHITNKLKRKLN